jgi:hypothetical protein
MEARDLGLGVTVGIPAEKPKVTLEESGQRTTKYETEGYLMMGKMMDKPVKTRQFLRRPLRRGFFGGGCCGCCNGCVDCIG